MKKHAFEIGQQVYHICSDGGVGIVLDISYSFRTKELLYNVAFGHGTEALWYLGFELCLNRNYYS